MKNKKIKLIIPLMLIIVFILFVFIYTKNDFHFYKFTDSSLIGYWKGQTEENPGFEIKDDGLYLDKTPLRYVIDGSGNITIYYTNFVFNGKYKIENDKLYLISKGSTDIYFRWCPEKNDVCN